MHYYPPFQRSAYSFEARVGPPDPMRAAIGDIVRNFAALEAEVATTLHTSWKGMRAGRLCLRGRSRVTPHWPAWKTRSASWRPPGRSIPVRSTRSRYVPSCGPAARRRCSCKPRSSIPPQRRRRAPVCSPGRTTGAPCRRNTARREPRGSWTRLGCSLSPIL
jgi:hypothetical protein